MPTDLNSTSATLYHPKLKKIYLLLIEPVINFWLRNWKVLFPVIVGAGVTLFIYFHSNANSTTKAPQEKNKEKTNVNHLKLH